MQRANKTYEKTFGNTDSSYRRVSHDKRRQTDLQTVVIDVSLTFLSRISKCLFPGMGKYKKLIKDIRLSKNSIFFISPTERDKARRAAKQKGAQTSTTLTSGLTLPKEQNQDQH